MTLTNFGRRTLSFIIVFDRWYVPTNLSLMRSAIRVFWARLYEKGRQRVSARQSFKRYAGAFLTLVAGLAAMAHTQFGVAFPRYSLPAVAVIACVGIWLFTSGGGWRSPR